MFANVKQYNKLISFFFLFRLQDNQPKRHVYGNTDEVSRKWKYMTLYLSKKNEDKKKTNQAEKRYRKNGKNAIELMFLFVCQVIRSVEKMTISLFFCLMHMQNVSIFGIA